MKKKINGFRKPGVDEPTPPYRLPTREEGRVLALAAENNFFVGWRSKPELYRRAAGLLGVDRLGEWKGLWVERRWSAPLRKLAAKHDGAGALCGILIYEGRRRG